MTTETSGETVDPTGAAERVISETAVEREKEAKRGRGRPPGARNKSKARDPRVEGPGRADEKPEPFVATVTPGDIEVASEIGDTVWSIVAPFGKLAPLDPSQRERLGKALAPLVQKYLPLLGGWQYEIAAAMVIFALVTECRRAYVPPDTGSEVVEIVE